MSVPASPFAGRLLSEIARCDGGLPAACAEMGITPQDIDAIAGGRMTSPLVLTVAYEWLAARVALEPGERDDYNRLREQTARHAIAAAAGGLPGGGQPSSQPVPPRLPGRAPIVRVATAAVVIVLIVVVTVVLTIMIVHPGGSRTAADSSHPPADPSASAAPVGATSPPALPVPPSPSPSDGGAGNPGPGLIASYYNYKLPCGDGITIGPGGPPAPQSGLGGDLGYDCAGTGTWYGGSGDELGLLTGQPTYSNCAKDTVVGGSLSSVTQGDTICVQGTGTIALVTLVGSGSTGGIDYVTLDVRVWRNQNTSGGN